jgi:hypothetical protein
MAREVAHEPSARVSVVARDLTARSESTIWVSQNAHPGEVESLLTLPMSGWMNLRMADFKVPISVDGVLRELSSRFAQCDLQLPSASNFRVARHSLGNAYHVLEESFWTSPGVQCSLR